jgi:hypothetical protein
MDRFPALRLILRHGRMAALLCSVGITFLLVIALYATLGLYSLALVPLLLPSTYLLVKSYVEIVQIVTEMVH